MKLLDYLKMHNGARLDLDDPQTTLQRRETIRRKRFMYKVYTRFYRQLLKRVPDMLEGPLIELGSGAGMIKEVIPNVKTSEVFSLPNLDMVLSGHHLPFKDRSVACFLMLDVFHHIPKPVQFLREAQRCLKKGGRVVMIEPYNSPFGRFIYQNFHHERFDPEAGWEQDSGGPLSGGNGALPWIIFVRDGDRFRKDFSELRINAFEPHTPFAYLISGGFTLRSMLPGFCFGCVHFAELLLKPLNSYIGMFVTITLEKS